jgi:antitoxin StbD
LAHLVLSEVVASVSELKRNPMGTVAAGQGSAVAILNRNEPAFYCVPAAIYESMLERLDDIELNAIADARANDAVIRVAIDEL